MKRTLKEIIDSAAIDRSFGASTGYDSVTSFKKTKTEPVEKKPEAKKVDEAVKKMWETRIFEEIAKLNGRIDNLQRESERANTALSESIKRTGKNIASAVEQRINTIEKSVQPSDAPKMCVYTCILGEYDELKPVLYNDSRIDYICFVDMDRKCYHNLGWKIRKIDFDLDTPIGVLTQRRIKILPHLFLSKYDISVWVDGTFQIVGDVYSMVENVISRNPQKVCFIRNHPERDCIYQEANTIKELKKADSKIIDQQVLVYKKEKYPEHFGLVETNIVVRKHNDSDCKKLMEMWFDELSKYTHRDQMSFNYCVWKLNFLKLGDLDLLQNKFFNGIIEHKKKHNKNVDIYITNFNTTELVNLLIRSIIKNVKSLRYRIIVVDNSTLKKFSLDESINLEGHSVQILDNTEKKLFDTDMFVEKYSKVDSKNNYASFRHAIAIQWILDTAENDVVLLDSDVVIKRDIDFIDEKYVTVADTGSNDFKVRFLPFIQYFNIKKIQGFHLKYLDIDRMHGGRNAANSKKYDTGASFYEDIIQRKIAYKTINHNVYVDHLKGGSWLGKNKEEFIEKESVYG